MLIALYFGYSRKNFGISSPNALHTTSSGLKISIAFWYLSTFFSV